MAPKIDPGGFRPQEASKVALGTLFWCKRNLSEVSNHCFRLAMSRSVNEEFSSRSELRCAVLR